ncbi:MAG: beta-galactosidase [Candidatus Sumerlaeota bacterium]|nr:beta-galactosidase [Candidatus Sumerlaeota bacterium]
MKQTTLAQRFVNRGSSVGIYLSVTVRAKALGCLLLAEMILILLLFPPAAGAAPKTTSASQPASAAASAEANPYGVWSYMGAMPDLSKAPHVRGKLVNAAWADVEPSPGAWDWAAFDEEMNQTAAAGLNIIVVIFSGAHSPSWIYEKGVPVVKTRGVRGRQSDTYPYYLTDEYKQLFRNLIVQARRHLDTLPAATRQRILAVQAGFSSTGDFGPYHGQLIDAKYEIPMDQWIAYYKEMAAFYQAQYQDARPRIHLLFNPSNESGKSGGLIDWLAENCPNSMIKCGNTGHFYQINGERDQVAILRSRLYARAGEDFLRARSEFGEDSGSGGWREAPEWNMYSLLQAALYVGLDINCIEGGDAILGDRRYFPAFEFFNRYAGQKDPATCPGAWCALRDGLDSADTARFPEQEFGEARLDNVDRCLAIAKAFAANGARQGDQQGGTTTGVRNRSLRALNDVGWEIYAGNYEMFLEQIDPKATSVGHWRVGPHEQPYGRYARGFDHASGKDAMCFRLDKNFFSAASSSAGFPAGKSDPSTANRQVDVRVVYFDAGKGRWALQYAAAGGSMKKAIEVEKTGTDQWKEINVPIAGASFEGKGPKGCDLLLQNTDDEDDIFHMVEVRRTRGE